MLQGQAFGREPQGGLPSRQRLLAVHAPVPKAGVAQAIQDPDEARREEGAPQLLLAVLTPEANPRTSAGERRPSSRPACAKWYWAL